MIDSKEIAQKALALAEKKAALKRRYLKIATSVSSVCAAFLFFFITMHAIPLFNINSGGDEPEELIFDDYLADGQVPLDGFFFPSEAEPVFIAPEDDFVFIDGVFLELDRLLINPSENSCYITFELVLADTGEIIFKSHMIAPSLGIDNIRLSNIPDNGVYPAVLIMRAYDANNFAQIACHESELNLIFE